MLTQREQRVGLVYFSRHWAVMKLMMLAGQGSSIPRLVIGCFGHELSAEQSIHF